MCVCEESLLGRTATCEPCSLCSLCIVSVVHCMRGGSVVHCMRGGSVTKMSGDSHYNYYHMYSKNLILSN